MRKSTAEARIQASIDELLQAQTRGDPERLTVLRAQMARDVSSPVPKKKPMQEWRRPKPGGRDVRRDNQRELLDYALRPKWQHGNNWCWRKGQNEKPGMGGPRRCWT